MYDDWRRTYVVRIRMSDGQKFAKDFNDRMEAVEYIKRIGRCSTHLFCFELSTIDDVWINPGQVVSVRIERVLE